MECLLVDREWLKPVEQYRALRNERWLELNAVVRWPQVVPRNLAHHPRVVNAPRVMNRFYADRIAFDVLHAVQHCIQRGVPEACVKFRSLPPRHASAIGKHLAFAE